MYVGRRKIGRGRLAGAHRLSGLRGGRRLVLGQDEGGINWGNVLTTSITDAASVAAVALRPPTYSSVVNPYTGAQSITSYAPLGSTPSLLGTTSLTGLLSSPLVLLGGVALLAVLALKR